MYKLQSILAVIPARGGSTRVPGKNTKLLGGRPLIDHTLITAAQVPELDLTVVSTDNAEISSRAETFGTRVITRPAALATAEAKTETAVLNALDVLTKEGQNFDYVLVLEPTSPLRMPQTVSRCIHRLIEEGGDSLLTVAPRSAIPGRIRDGLFQPLVENAPRRSQDREPLYEEAGVAYVCRVSHLRKSSSLTATCWLAEPVSPREAIDINEPLDFLIAQALIDETEDQV